jgi:hypothetical protein
LDTKNLGDGGLGRQAALDQSRWRRGLHDTVLASPAGVFGPPGDEQPELCRHDVEPLALVLADPVRRQHSPAGSSFGTLLIPALAMPAVRDGA